MSTFKINVPNCTLRQSNQFKRCLHTVFLYMFIVKTVHQQKVTFGNVASLNVTGNETSPIRKRHQGQNGHT
jgi:hypothetical protein